MLKWSRNHRATEASDILLLFQWRIARALHMCWCTHIYILKYVRGCVSKQRRWKVKWCGGSFNMQQQSKRVESCMQFAEEESAKTIQTAYLYKAYHHIEYIHTWASVAFKTIQMFRYWWILMREALCKTTKSFCINVCSSEFYTYIILFSLFK